MSSGRIVALVAMAIGFSRVVSPSPDEAVIAANEAAALGDLRTIMSAEAAYLNVNGGFYDAPACLYAPSRCIPGYPADGPTFLDEAVASLTIKDGYGRAFSSRGGESPSRAEFYAVILWPDEPGKTGRRAFCGDADGVICFTEDGKAPKLGRDGRCPVREESGQVPGCEVVH